jgi:hypothetical protein
MKRYAIFTNMTEEMRLRARKAETLHAPTNRSSVTAPDAIKRHQNIKITHLKHIRVEIWLNTKHFPRTWRGETDQQRKKSSFEPCGTTLSPFQRTVI